MKNKKLIYGIIIAIIIIIACICLFGGKKSVGTISFATEKTNRGNISNFITATGTIEPVTEVEVGTQVSGIIDKIYVDYNSIVKKGELIAEMDKVTLQSELQSAKASYDGAKADFDYQKKLYDRNTRLHDKQLISETDYESSQYNYELAKSQFESSRAALAKAQRNLSYATITSPIDGIVTSKSVEEGQTVASGFETPTLFTIAADLTKMRVIADVDEADIANVKEGAKVNFTVDAYPDDIFEGTVQQVRLGSTNSSSSSSSSSSSGSSSTVVTYEVVITADNSEMKLKPRLTANATIYTLNKDNVLRVPTKALRFTPNKNIVKGYNIKDVNAAHKVWTLDGKTLTAHAVQIGTTDGTNTEILNGMDENTPVVTEIKINQTEEMAKKDDSERSPFQMGPPDRNKKKNGATGNDSTNETNRNVDNNQRAK
ncbi:efflux RND transporter periplasmic adaptor subunit [Phocaeicola oris]|uniref:efflux RND transporter periplasmic adaptor subunit n=1 Tax=Phocaeicola oris TaxID=2896850 RepID=UPI00234F767E|nr:efflux RND transporter periplasmic adaptor subunit [Phocaeicola oris]MCE2616470.1 efflux RND transporter periplasmic adaptor subunit [Phocaeicola oris]